MEWAGSRLAARHRWLYQKCSPAPSGTSLQSHQDQASQTPLRRKQKAHEANLSVNEEQISAQNVTKAPVHIGLQGVILDSRQMLNPVDKALPAKVHEADMRADKHADLRSGEEERENENIVGQRDWGAPLGSVLQGGEDDEEGVDDQSEALDNVCGQEMVAVSNQKCVVTQT